MGFDVNGFGNPSAGGGSGDALTSGTLAQFAATTSAELRGVLSDETGTGAAVFATAPTFPTTLTIGAASGATGQLLMKGTTSGTVTIKTADAAGTYTLTLPTDDGTSNQVLTTDGAGVLSWTTASGSTYDESNPINDTSTNQLLEFAKTTSANNHWKMTNNSTGNAPILTAGGTGSDANLDGIIQASGTGKISILGSSLNISSDSSWSPGDTFKLGFGAGSEAGYLSGGWGLTMTLRNDGGTQTKIQTNNSNTLIADVVYGDYAQFSHSATAGHTKFLVYDVDNGQLERVSVGAADSGGAGFKVLRIPN